MSDVSELSPPVVLIAGFGLPGRFVAEILETQRIAYTVIDVNQRLTKTTGTAVARFITGDVRDPQVLRTAGIESAAMLVLTIPDDKAALEAIAVARQIKPDIRVFARCSFTSSGLRARKLGAEDVVVAEQAVAEQLAQVMRQVLDAASELKTR